MEKSTAEESALVLGALRRAIMVLKGAEQEGMIKATDRAAVFEELRARTSW